MTIDEIVRLEIEREARKPKTSDRDKRAFYNSRAWRQCRYQALKAANGRCQACGRGPADGVRLVVDHILPIKTHWHLRLSPKKLQCLCNDDNLAKASADTTDWRK